MNHCHALTIVICILFILILQITAYGALWPMTLGRFKRGLHSEKTSANEFGSMAPSHAATVQQIMEAATAAELSNSHNADDADGVWDHRLGDCSRKSAAGYPGFNKRATR